MREILSKNSFFYFSFQPNAVKIMQLSYISLILALNIKWRTAWAQENIMQYFMEQANFLIFNSSYIIEDTVDFLPSYDFIVIGSGSGG